MQIATEILNQLGGNKFIVMTGAKNFVGSEDSLMFNIPSTLTKNKINKCRITLDPSDTYTVVFYKWNARKLEMVTISKATDVYNDMLQEVFTSHTGLYTRL